MSRGVKPSRDGLAEMAARQGAAAAAAVAEAAFRRGFQQGIFMVGEELNDCGSLEEAWRLLTRANKEAARMRYTSKAWERYGDVFVERLRAGKK